MSSSMIKNMTWVANIALVAWVFYHLAFMNGYQDAVNDLAKKGYNFENTRKAFK